MAGTKQHGKAMEAARTVTPEVVQPGAMAGFDGGGAIASSDNELGIQARIAQVRAELQTAVFMARQFPRNEQAAYTKLMRSCDRPAFAADAAYRYKRGKMQDEHGKWVDNFIEGPSVDLAREAARCWGNIRYGIRIAALDDDNVHIEGWAYDCETNNAVTTEDKFARLIQRKVDGETRWVRPDERDLRELINRRGAICERNAILKVLPPDVIDDARKAANGTLRKAAEGALKENRAEATRKLVLRFDEIGVTVEMLERYLGHDLMALTVDEMTELRKIGKSIADGQSKRDEHFEFQKPQGAASQGGRIQATVDVNAVVGAATSGPGAATPNRDAPQPPPGAIDTTLTPEQIAARERRREELKQQALALEGGGTGGEKQG
jgi:hypothetical protein